MIGAAAIALLLALLVQNVDEYRSGGPAPPPPLARRLRQPPAALTGPVLIVVSLAFALLLAAALMLPWHPLAAMLAGGCLANAAVQGLQSIRRRQWQPGTITGLTLMVPAAVWLLAALDGPPAQTLFWAALGIVAMPPLLAALWLATDRATA